MRESQGEDEGVLEVHAWTEHASAPASGTRLIRRVAHARNRKPHVCMYVCVRVSLSPALLLLFFLSAERNTGRFRGAGFNIEFDVESLLCRSRKILRKVSHCIRLARCSNLE